LKESDSLVISGVVRVRNNADDLRRCLEGFRNQTLPADARLELVVVDNESTDSSAETARELGANVVPISTAQFSWGRALNVGIRESSGSIIVILSSDAYPANETWLAEMIRPFEDPAVAAVYGRQIPRPDAPIDEQIRLRSHFREQSFVTDHIPDHFSADGGVLCVSNVSAAIRRSLWEALPYDEKIAGGEEGIWTYEYLRQGRKIVYQASACVYHSHRDSIGRYAWRNWELLNKSATLNHRRVRLGTVLHAGLSIAKRRILNMFHSKISWRCRIIGFCRLPFEILALYSIALVTWKKGSSSAVRSFYWDSRW
jgi:rhamnosyltransferase